MRDPSVVQIAREDDGIPYPRLAEDAQEPLPRHRVRIPLVKFVLRLPRTADVEPRDRDLLGEHVPARVGARQPIEEPVLLLSAEHGARRVEDLWTQRASTIPTRLRTAAVLTRVEEVDVEEIA